jgi:hypothetical protein
VSQQSIKTKIGGWAFDQDDKFSQSAVTKITNASVFALSPGGGTFHSSNAVNGGGSGLGDIYYRFAWSGN